MAWVRVDEYRVSPLSFGLTSFAPLIVSDIAPDRLDRFFFDALSDTCSLIVNHDFPLARLKCVRRAAAFLH